jgi:ComF family protein
VTRVRVPSSAWLVDLVLPSRCVCCGASGDALCASCRCSLRRVAEPRCARCGAPTVWPVARCRECAGRRLAFSSARAAVVYAGPARPLVAAWKEHGVRRIGVLAADLVAEALPRPAADVITHIPADPDRLLRRGHNPAERLGRELSRRWELPFAQLLLRRPSRSSSRQTELAREERARNVRGAFLAGAKPPPHVVLVDDVYTTGATVAAASSALRGAGARTVDVVTFARTVRL